MEKYIENKAKTFIRLGFLWSILIFVVSVIIDYVTPSDISNKGAFVFFMAIILNIPGTSLFFYSGARKLRNCDMTCLAETKIMESRKIIYFGIFWLFFWMILSYIFLQYDIITGDVFPVFILFIGIPGTFIYSIIGYWSSRIDVTKGWKELSDAQKKFNQEKTELEKIREKLSIKKEELLYLEREHDKRSEKLDIRTKELEKEQKSLKKLKEDNNTKITEIETQKKDIEKARSELQATWGELESTIKENPFKLFLSDKLGKDIFIKEIEEFKKTKPGDVSSIKTDADKVIYDIQAQFRNEISKFEDEKYSEAFYDYFKMKKDAAEQDRIRIKYNPTIHNQEERRNKEWAERRRFNITKIEKIMESEKLKR